MDPQKLILFFQSLAGQDGILEERESTGRSKLRTIFEFVYTQDEVEEGTIYGVTHEHILEMSMQTARERIVAALNIFRCGKTDHHRFGFYRRELENANNGIEDFLYLVNMARFSRNSYLFFEWKIPVKLPKELIEMLDNAANCYLVHIRFIMHKGGIGLKLPNTVAKFSMSTRAAKWMKLLFPNEVGRNCFLAVGRAVVLELLSSDYTPLSAENYEGDDM